MKRFLAGILALGLILSLTACKEASAEKQVFAMDTVMMLTAYGDQSEEALKAAELELYRLDSLLSKTDEGSTVSALNGAAGAATTVEGEVLELLELAKVYSGETGGAFDITISPVVSAWGFTEDAYRVPDEAELKELLSSVGSERIKLNGDTAVLEQGTEIDLGGIAKGYASDRVAEIFRSYEISRGTVVLGGNALAAGTREDGQAWRVGVRDPKNSEGLVGLVHLEDAYAVTSGGYERYFEENGKTYHHIIDPATGYPAESGLTSVTVVADCKEPGTRNGTMCDALSTALFVMGEERALEFWRDGGLEFEVVLVTEDGRVVVTEGLADRFTESEESGYTYETVS